MLILDYVWYQIWLVSPSSEALFAICYSCLLYTKGKTGNFFRFRAVQPINITYDSQESTRTIWTVWFSSTEPGTNHAIPRSTMQYHAASCNSNTMLYIAIPRNIMQYHPVPWSTTQYHAIPNNTRQFDEAHRGPTIATFPFPFFKKPISREQKYDQSIMETGSGWKWMITPWLSNGYN